MPCPLTKVEGPSAYMRAAATMSLGGHAGEPFGDRRRILRGARGQLHRSHGTSGRRTPCRRGPRLISTWIMASASAASVPTRGASHRSAICAACVRLGSIDDDARAALLGGLERGPLDRIGDARVAADDQRAARVVDVLAAGDVEAHGARAHGAAAAAQVLVDHPVGRADRAQRQRQDHAAAEIGAAGGADDRLGSVFLAHLRPAGRPSPPAPRPRRRAPTCPRRARRPGAWDGAGGWGRR